MDLVRFFCCVEILKIFKLLGTIYGRGGWRVAFCFPKYIENHANKNSK